MKFGTRLAVLSLILAIGAHVYLTNHYYPLHFGFSNGDSICNINQKFNCDAVSASRYSALFGVPLSIWGAVTNAVLLLMFVFAAAGWTDDRKLSLRYCFWLASTSALGSIVMGVISFALVGYYCLFCLIAYLLSFISWDAIRRQQEGPPFPYLVADLKGLLTSQRGALITFLSIPLVSYLVHASIMDRLGGRNVEQVVRARLSDWTRMPAREFDAPPSLTKGNPQSSFVIAEFADFLCGHCRQAYPTIKAFQQANPAVRVDFYSFPLDSSCNEAITEGHGDGIRCYLAKAVYCGNQQHKGWELHDAIFDHQEELNRNQSLLPKVEELVQGLSVSLGIDWSQLQECSKSEAAQQAIANQGRLGKRLDIKGTPTIFANGRFLPDGQLMPVLTGAEALSR